MKNVKLPDGRTAQFPASMSNAEIEAVLQRQFGGASEKVSRPYAALQTGLHGATYAFSDEIQAGIGALYANLMGGIPFNEAYDTILGQSRGELASAREQFPVQSFATEALGSLTTGMGTTRALGRLAPGLAKTAQATAASRPVATAAVSGAGTGALYGAGAAEEGQRWLGAATGLVASGAGGVAGGYLLSKAAPRLGPLGKRLFVKNADDIAVLREKTGVNLGDDIARQAKKGVDVGDDIANRAAKNIAGATTEPDSVYSTVRSAVDSLLPEDQAARSRVLAQAGIPREQQTAGMVTRDPKIWQFEQNIRGIQDVGDEIRQRYVTANNLIRQKLDEIGAGLKGTATSAYEAGENITDAVLKKSKEMQDEIGALYGRVRENVGDDIGMKPQRVLMTLDEASDNAYADKIVNSMARKMKRYGIIDKDGLPTGDALSVKNAEELRKFANSLRGDKQTDHVVAKIIDSLDDDVIETAGVDAFAQARDKARLKFKEFESKLLENITRGKLVADDVMKKVAYQGKIKDIADLKTSLFTGSQAQIARGAQAWSDIKLQTLQDIIDNSTSAGGKLQGSRFARQLNKIGNERLRLIFEPAELAQISLIRDALEYTTIEVPESVVNYSGTGAAAANNALSGIIKKSRVGEFVQKASDAVSSVPVFGQLTSPVTALGTISAKQMQGAAQRQSVQNLLNPQRALGTIQVDPRLSASVGVPAGVLAGQPGAIQ